MENQKRKRIQNSNIYLSEFLQENESFFIGIPFEEFASCVALSKYKLPTIFNEGDSIIPNPVGSTTKSNVNGKFVRKQPEEKEEITKHIEQRRKKDKTLVKFDRIYHVYIKEFQHKFNISLNFLTNKHNQQIVVSEKLIYNEESAIKNTHTINVFCEIFNTFEVLTTECEFAIHFNKKFEMELLPKGTLINNENFDEVVRISSHYTRNETEQKAFIKRLQLLKEYNPDIRGKGPNNFFGYIVFGFSEFEIVILETMYSDNATYVFKMVDYENNVILDKQTVLKNKLLIKRFYHHDNWETNVKAYFTDLKNEMNEKTANIR